MCFKIYQLEYWTVVDDLLIHRRLLKLFQFIRKFQTLLFRTVSHFVDVVRLIDGFETGILDLRLDVEPVVIKPFIPHNRNRQSKKP